MSRFIRIIIFTILIAAIVFFVFKTNIAMLNNITNSASESNTIETTGKTVASTPLRTLTSYQATSDRSESTSEKPDLAIEKSPNKKTGKPDVKEEIKKKDDNEPKKP